MKNLIKKYSYNLQSIGLLLFLIIVISLQVKAQISPCSAFTGLPAVCCPSDSPSILIPTNIGGVFSGPGIVGNTFNPSLAGAGVHSISYSLLPNYTSSVIPWVNNLAQPTNYISTANDHFNTEPIPIGFTFKFWGISYNYFAIHSDGYITFDTTFKDTNNAVYDLGLNSTPNNLIAGVWTKIYNPGPGTIAYQVYGSAPNRYLLVTWKSKRYSSTATSADVSFSIILRETSNIIETFINVANQTHAAVGLENNDGTKIVLPNYNFDYNHFNVSSASPIAFRYTPTMNCTEISTQHIKVRPSPTIQITSNSDFVCPGNSTVLHAHGAAQYTWQPGNSSGDSLVVSPNTPTTYSCIGTDLYQCVFETKVTITTGNDLFFPITSSKQYICLGDSTILKAKSGYNYVWQPGNITGDSIEVSPNVTTTYTITGTSHNGCSGTVLFTVYVMNFNNVTISPNITPCTDTLFVDIPGNYVLQKKKYILSNEYQECNYINTMNKLFGYSGWQQATTNSNMDSIFNDSTQFVVIYCGDNPYLSNFINQYQQKIEHWVARGGRLLFTYLYYNTLPVYPELNIGFNNTKINAGFFVDTSFSYNTNHPLYNQVKTKNLRDYYAVKSYFEGTNVQGLIRAGTSVGNNFKIISGEKRWGNGLVYCHALNPTYYDVLLQDILRYVAQSPLNDIQYTWNTQSHLPYQIPLMANTQYSVQVQAGNCSASANYTPISIKPSVANISVFNDSICEGGTISLQCNSNVPIIWEPGQLSNQTIQVSPLSTTIYTVTATNAAGCSASNTTQVHVKNKIKGIITPSYANCKTTQLKANVFIDNYRTKQYLIENDAIGVNFQTTPPIGYNEYFFQYQFGVKYYQKLKYNEVNFDSVFSPQTYFVCMEGSYLSNKNAFWTFYNANRNKIEKWVYEGGHLLIHCSSLYANIGFGNTMVGHSSQNILDAHVYPSIVDYPANSKTFNSFGIYSYTSIYGEGWQPLIYLVSEIICGKKSWGLGSVVVNSGLSEYPISSDTHFKILFYNLNYYAAELDNYKGNYPCTFLWNTQEQLQTISPSQNGTYTVVIKSTPGYYCTDTATIIIHDTLSHIDTFHITNTGPSDSLIGSYHIVANIPVGVENYTLKWFNKGQLIKQAQFHDYELDYSPISNNDSVYAQIDLPCNDPISIQSNIVPLIKTNEPEELGIYPNPTSGQLNISGLLHGDDIRLMDMLGNTLFKEKIEKPGTYSFPMHSLSRGVYILRIIQGDQKLSTRIVKD
jgi:hypothetical protein